MDYLVPNFDDRWVAALLKLGIAMVCGLIIGVEREYRGKAAGLRTYMLICMGSCLFAIVSEFVAYQALADGLRNADPGRISAQVVTGIGFLGAGAIIQRSGGVSGLTTAAGIWGAAAIGLAVGSGMTVIAFISSIGFVITMESFTLVGKTMYIRRYQVYDLVVVIKKEARIHDVRKILRDMKIEFGEESVDTIVGENHYKVQLTFKGELEDELSERVLALKGVKDVRLLRSAAE